VQLIAPATHAGRIFDFEGFGFSSLLADVHQSLFSDLPRAADFHASIRSVVGPHEYPMKRPDSSTRFTTRRLSIGKLRAIAE